MGKRVISRKKTYEYGNYKEIEIFPVYSGTHRRVREAKTKISRKAQKQLNKKNRIKKIFRLLHGNFKQNDYFITLTYSDKFVPKSIEEAQTDYRNFMVRLRRLYNRDGKELKYMAWIEKGVENGRIHHHLVLSGGICREEIENLFGKGFCNVSRLNFGQDDLMGLAEYFAKDPKGKRTFTCSKNLDRECLKAKKTEDNKTSKALISKMIENKDDKSLYEKLYPGYEPVKIETPINEYTRAVSISIILRKKNIIFG